MTKPTQSAQYHFAKRLFWGICLLAGIHLFADDRWPTKNVWPNAQRGAEMSKTGFSDAVNLFSGSVNMHIPLAVLETPAGYSLPFSLFYDSSIWQEVIRPEDDEFARSSRTFFSPFEAYYDALINQVAGNGPIQDPDNFYCNAGHGWLLDVGRIIPVDYDGIKVIYAAPNHARNQFFETLHVGDPVQPNVWYTRDGSYLRYVKTGNLFSTGELHFPDGTVHFFSQGIFTGMEDPHGNRIVMEATPTTPQEVVQAGGENIGKRYKYTETHSGKTVTIGFSPFFAMDGQGNAILNRNGDMVEWIETDASGTQANGQPNRARTSFTYNETFLPYDGLCQLGPPIHEQPAFCQLNTDDYDERSCTQWRYTWMGENCEYWCVPNPDLYPNPCWITLPDGSPNPNYNWDTCNDWLLAWGDNNCQPYQMELGVPTSCLQGHPDFDFFPCQTEKAQRYRSAWRRFRAGVVPGTLIPNFPDESSLWIRFDKPLNIVTLPDGTDFRFKYGTWSQADGGPEGHLAGALAIVDLPTGGKIRYEYQPHRIPDNLDPDSRFSDRFDELNYWSPTMGVSKVEKLDVDGRQLDVRRYRRGVLDHPGNMTGYLGVIIDQSTVTRDIYVVETDARNNDTVHYFRTPPVLPEQYSGWGTSWWDFASPYTRSEFISNAYPGEGSRRAFLSREIYEGPALRANGSRGNLLVSQWVTYERDLRDADSPHSGFNRRLKYQRTLYHDDLVNGNPRYRDLLMKDFDGLGNYRTTISGGNFESGNQVTVSKLFNPGSRNYDVKDSGAGGDHETTFLPASTFNYQAPPFNAPWILKTHTKEERTEGNQVATTEFQFDSSTGKVLRSRRLASFDGTQSSNDILTSHSYDNRGGLTQVVKYGGDRQKDLPGASGNPISLGEIDLTSLSPDYRTDYLNDYDAHTYKTIEVDPDSDERFTTEHRVLETHSGLVMQTKTAAGFTTTYNYDLFDRKISTTPQGQSSLIHQYIPATAEEGPKVISTQGSGSQTIETVTTYNGLRAPIGHSTLLPLASGSHLVSTWDYFDQGVLAATSYPSTESGPIHNVTYEYDALNRETERTQPDGSVLTSAYSGTSRKTLTSSVATHLNGTERQISKTHVYDGQERLIRVEEPNADGTGTLITEYGYDVLDNLTSVTMGAQTRSFTYDGRGFLRQEVHPENGTTTHSRYDSKGNVGRMERGSLSLDYTYDGFGRLIQVREGDQILHDEFYARENLGDSQSAGKLVQARRFNYFQDPIAGLPNPLVVTQTFIYEGLGGSLSEMRTRTNSGLQFVQLLEYDNLGQISQIHYPQKIAQGFPHSELLFGADEETIVTPQYRHGMLSGIQRIIQHIHYHPNGIIADILHANQVSDLTLADPHGMNRPRLMETSGANQDWNSGIMAYDGSGNIKSLGASRFAYDYMNRLKSADTENGELRHYEYDRYGNTQRMGSQNFQVNPATNQITDENYHYDEHGSMTQMGAVYYEYDGFQRTIGSARDGLWERYLYDPDNNRIATLKSDGSQIWTIRNQVGQLLREYSTPAADVFLDAQKDYFYGPQLLGSLEHATGTVKHHHLDHLGSVRLTTDADGNTVAQREYYPFGEEIDLNEDEERFKFARAERDFDDQDYLQARFLHPNIGRFSAVDPVLGSPETTLSWNRYSYVQNSPLNYIDPSGEIIIPLFSDLLSELMMLGGEENNPLYQQALAWETIDQLLKKANEYLQDKAVDNAEDDGIALLLLTLELLLPDNSSELVWEVGLTLATAGLGKGLSQSEKAIRRSRAANRGSDLSSSPVGRQTRLGGEGAHNTQLTNTAYQRVRNTPGTVNGREYTAHAFDQMQNRGLTPTVVENAIRTGTRSAGNHAGTFKFHDAVNNVTVITNDIGRVITAY